MKIIKDLSSLTDLNVLKEYEARKFEFEWKRDSYNPHLIFQRSQCLDFTISFLCFPFLFYKFCLHSIEKHTSLHAYPIHLSKPFKPIVVSFPRSKSLFVKSSYRRLDIAPYTVYHFRAYYFTFLVHFQS